MTRLLAIMSHPDDAELGCAGLIIKTVMDGGSVFVLYLTSGEHGIPGKSIEEAREIREEEARQAARILSYDIVGFWRLPDGQLTYSKKLRDSIAKEIEIWSPDLIVTLHEGESHSDHRVTGQLVREALKTLEYPPSAITAEIWTPQLRAQRVLNISDVIDKKMEAIRVHKSQVGRIAFDEAALSLAHYQGILHGKCQYAEVYNTLRLSGESGMRIGLALLTYAPSFDHPRAEYARKTLESTLKFLECGNGNTLHVHIADDGSDRKHVDALQEICAKYGYPIPSWTNAERGGYGKSYNLMMQAIHSSCDLILPLEDDWELTRPLNLEHLAKALDESNGEIRSIRLGYLGITQPLKGTVMFRSGQTFLLLDPDSPEPHVFCGHPRLETVEYERDIGAWPEGISAGNVEWEVTHRWPARTGVAWPLDINLPASQDWGGIFVHIGSESLGGLVPEGIATVG